MPFNPLLPVDRRLAFHTRLYLAFRERGREQQIHVQVYGAEAGPFFWLDDLNFGVRFDRRGMLIQKQLDARVELDDIKLKSDYKNPTGCTFVSGLSVAKPREDVWRAPLALALGMKPNGRTKPNGRSRGRFMVTQGEDVRIWLGHRGGLAGGGAGGVKVLEFHKQLPLLKKTLQDSQRHINLVDGLSEAFDEVFCCNFVPDDLVHTPLKTERVFPIAAYDETEKFFQTLASYVHQCYVLRRLRQERII